ncbi:hypothetical protein EMCRGX_G023021 [Ephydatia muelleri]
MALSSASVVTVTMEEQSTSSSLQHNLRTIFDLCDQDRDGVIAVRDFERIGRDHLENAQQIELLVKEIDPDGSGNITFDSFCQGVEAFLHSSEPHTPIKTVPSPLATSFEEASGHPHQCTLHIPLPQRLDCYFVIHLNSADSDGPYSSSDDVSVHPLTLQHTQSQQSPINGFGPVKPRVWPGCSESSDRDSDDEPLPPLQSTYVKRVNLPYRVANFWCGEMLSYRDSPRAAATRLMHRGNTEVLIGRHDVVAGTPEEHIEEEITKLSDQLHNLSSKLHHLQKDQESTVDIKSKLRRDNNELRQRLEAYEEKLKDSELSSQKQLNESKNKLEAAVAKLKAEKDTEMDGLKLELQSTRGRLSESAKVEQRLQCELITWQEECAKKDVKAAAAEQSLVLVQEELAKTRAQLVEEKEQWLKSVGTYEKMVSDKDSEIHRLQEVCEEYDEAKREKTAVIADLNRQNEVLQKELEKVRQEAEDLRAHLVQQGTTLLTRNKQSLAAELESASTDELRKALEEEEDHNVRLHKYIEGLLVAIIDKHPDILEKR